MKIEPNKIHVFSKKAIEKKSRNNRQKKEKTAEWP